MDWLKSVLFDFLYLKRFAKCDGCSGSFKKSDLCATSGDWWLCPKCMDKLNVDLKDEQILRLKEQVEFLEQMARDPRTRLPLIGECFHTPQMIQPVRKVTSVTRGAHTTTRIEFELREGTTNEKVVGTSSTSFEDWLKYVVGMPIGAISLGLFKEPELEKVDESRTE